MRRPYRIQIYADIAGLYRWRFIAPNGRIIATSGESYSSLSNAKRAALRFNNLRFNEYPVVEIK